MESKIMISFLAFRTIHIMMPMLLEVYHVKLLNSHLKDLVDYNLDAYWNLMCLSSHCEASVNDFALARQWKTKVREKVPKLSLLNLAQNGFRNSTWCFKLHFIRYNRKKVAI